MRGKEAKPSLPVYWEGWLVGWLVGEFTGHTHTPDLMGGTCADSLSEKGMTMLPTSADSGVPAMLVTCGTNDLPAMPAGGQHSTR